MRHIDHTYYINLDKREDRNKHIIETVLPFFKLKEGEFTRIPAVDTSLAPNLSLRSVGCAQSHLDTYRDAKSKGYKYILVLEDDFTPIIEQEVFFINLDYLFENFPDFNVCQIAYNDEQMSFPISPNGQIRFCANVQTTSGYIIKTSFTDVISPTIANSIECLKDNQPSQIYAIDRCWKKFQTIKNQWLLMQRTGIQRNDYSNLEQENVNYDC